jgi:hypothetical protein
MKKQVLIAGGGIGGMAAALAASRAGWDVLLSNETIWLTQKRMAELFGVGVAAISKHLDNIYESGELQREATLSVLETVQQEGARQVTRKLE